jgi:hypothetical protein
MTEQEKLSRAWFAVEAHCIVSPSGTAPVYKDFRRDLIAKYGALRTAAVRAETLREVRGVVEKMPKGSTLSVRNEVLMEVFSRLDALAHPEGTDK